MQFNWIGPQGSAYGLGIQSQSIALELYRMGHDIVFITTTVQGEIEAELMPAILAANRLDIGKPTIRFGPCHASEPLQLFGSVRIAYTVWEVTPVPSAAVKALNTCDRIWVPSQWVANVFMESGIDVPIDIVPGGVDSRLFHPSVPAADTPAKKRSFRFLSIGKWEARKGFDILLRAFAEAFDPDDDVELLIHTSIDVPTYSIPTAVLDLNLPPHAPIIISTRLLPRSGIAPLMRTADAFVLTSRGEGFPLPVIEAMACGLPVLTTVTSGTSEFCNHNNCLVVECEGLIPVYDPVYTNYWPAHSIWFQPSIESAVEQLRRAVTDSNIMARLANVSAQEAGKWTWKHSADKVCGVLDEITGTELIDVFGGTTTLVTGASGFIGSHLVERLLEIGADVHACDVVQTDTFNNATATRRSVEFYQVDIRRIHNIERIIYHVQPQYVFHLAANASVPNSVQNPVYDFHSNCVGTFHVLQALRNVSGCKKVVIASSGAVYGEPQTLPITEISPLRPISPYGASKLNCEVTAQMIHTVYKVPAVIGRIFSTYGPRMSRFVVFDLLCKLYKNPEHLEVLGSGQQIRDFTYVADTVEGLVLLACHGVPGEAYNISSGVSYSVADLVNQLISMKQLQDKTQIIYTGHSWIGDVQHWEVSIDKIGALGYLPSYALKEGLEKTQSWFDQTWSHGKTNVV